MLLMENVRVVIFVLIYSSLFLIYAIVSILHTGSSPNQGNHKPGGGGVDTLLEDIAVSGNGANHV